MSNLLSMTVAGSVIVGLMLLLRPVTMKIFPAGWQYRIGKMAIFFLLVPVSLFTGKLTSFFPQSIIPSHYSITTSMAIQKEVQSTGLVDAMNSVIERHFPMVLEKHLSVEVMQMILCFWLVGVFTFGVWHFYCYSRFTNELRSNSILAPENASALLSSCKTVMDIHCKIRLMQNPKITSPMLVGFRHPMILLPKIDIPEIELKLTLTHELTHLKRKDLWIKMFALVAGTLHWFNPFAYVLRKDISRWSELSCDEVLATEMSHEERRLYGETILNTLDIHSGINTAFCSSLCESKRHIERRLTMLLNVKKTKKYIVFLAAVAILAISATGIAFAAGSEKIVNYNTVNATVEKTESQLGINVDRKLTECKKVINVDIKSLRSGEFVCLGEYTLDAGDLIAYNLTAEGEGNINVGFFKTDSPSDIEGYLGYAMYTGNYIFDKLFHLKVNDKQAGTYFLRVENFEGATLNNLKGTVEIAVENQQAE